MLPVALRALIPARATVEAEVRLVVELSADAPLLVRSAAALTVELAVKVERPRKVSVDA